MTDSIHSFVHDTNFIISYEETFLLGEIFILHHICMETCSACLNLHLHTCVLLVAKGLMVSYKIYNLKKKFHRIIYWRFHILGNHEYMFIRYYVTLRFHCISLYILCSSTSTCMNTHEKSL